MLLLKPEYIREVVGEIRFIVHEIKSWTSNCLNDQGGAGENSVWVSLGEVGLSAGQHHSIFSKFFVKGWRKVS